MKLFNVNVFFFCFELNFWCVCVFFDVISFPLIRWEIIFSSVIILKNIKSTQQVSLSLYIDAINDHDDMTSIVNPSRHRLFSTMKQKINFFQNRFRFSLVRHSYRHVRHLHRTLVVS